MSVRCDDCFRLFAPNERAPSHCVSCLRAKVADLTRRIRLAMRAYRKEWGHDVVSKRLADVVAPLDLRKPLSRRTKRTKS